MKIGLTMPLAEDDRSHPPSYAELRTLAQHAEAAGLDSLWVFDHLFLDRGFVGLADGHFTTDDPPLVGVHECWTILAALAADTHRVELGTLVVATGFRNPALLAKMAVTADEVSGGRLVLGVGCGWNPPEYEAFGFPYDNRVARFEEALQIIHPLLRGERVTFRGTYYQTVDAVLRPGGPRPTGPPVLIASRKPRMHRLVARYADLWNTAWLGDPADLDRRMIGLQDACRAEERDMATLAITVGVNVVFGDLLSGRERLPRASVPGSSEALARALDGYAMRGVDQVIFRLTPCTPAAIDAVAAVVMNVIPTFTEST